MLTIARMTRQVPQWWPCHRERASAAREKVNQGMIDKHPTDNQVQKKAPRRGL